MKISRKGQAGTMQSSDLMVTVEPADHLTVDVQSTVKVQFEHLIRAKINQVLEKFNITSGHISISDRGALDYAIEARLEAALQRAGAI